MAVESRARVILALLLAVAAAGCSLAPKSPPAARPALTQEEADWWAANQHRKMYVPGKGYYVEGTSGYFDYDGHKLPSDPNATMTSDDEAKTLADRLSMKNISKKVKLALGKGPDEKIAKTALEQGDQFFRQKDYVKAAEEYRTAYKRWPDSPLEEEAIFKAAESEFFADHYSKADDEYALLIKKYASSQYLSLVTVRRFAIGRYWEQCDQTNPHWMLTPNVKDKTRPLFDTAGHAMRVYERIRLDDPTGPWADDSVMAAANYYFRKGHWEEADYHYGLLRSEFPKSEFQFQAHLLGLRCKLLRYQGPGYEGGPLDDAEELANQLLTQFPTELGAERDRVVQVRAGIRDQRALRQWDMASFYDRGQYYAAAKFYYQKVVKDYPETKLAENCRKRMGEIKELPDNPTRPFDWLVKILPESRKEGPVVPKKLLEGGSGDSASVASSTAAPTTVTR